MTLWVNGRIVPDDAPVVRADDHGLVVGDGVFETCKVLNGQVFALTRHLGRLRRSADKLGLAYDETVVRQGIAAVLGDAPDRARLRITLTGGPSPYGSARGDAAPTTLVALGALATWPAAADVVVVPWTRNENAPTAGVKTTSYADNVIAITYAHQRDAAEAIYANTRGELCEGTGSNVFVVKDGSLLTPPLTSGCLAGITRDLVIEWCGDVVETELPIDALSDSDEAFLASSTRDVQPIRAVDGKPLPAAPGPVTQRVMDVFADRSPEELGR